MMPNFKKVAAVVLTLTALATVLVLAFPETASADRCGTEFLYFSDASYSEVVGIRGWLPYSCNCQFYTWGEITIYKVVQDSWC
ncbi:MAG TPA: hypothetical protein VFR31_04340 [Thermoanaerobaculia bacterium]|nr:hypothetical protein [Thermoanaerobaculia bacterium]